ncbi:MAG TPA: DNA mismatch repair protein MutS [Thermomicrobiales bacterium]|nr:DNA mismatch repair protein MutS [Thermomicrobiales bacterium]
MTTPIRRQYLSIKRQYPDIVVFFRLGDFYETFDDDAVLASEVLGLTLTSREMGRGNRVPMAGIPYHAAEGYIARLLAAGHKVAIAEQMDKPNRRDLVDRQVTSVVTPGTVTDPAFVQGSGNTYIVALISDGGRAGLAYADVSTGEFATTRLGTGVDTDELVRRELLRLNPAEIVARADEPLLESAPPAVARSIERNEAWRLDDATDALRAHFGVASLEGFGCVGEPLAVRAAGGLLAYLQGTQRNSLRQITSLSTYSMSRFMSLDAQTRRNLELVESSSRGDGPSLFKTIDATRTPLGARLLRQWVNQPLLVKEDIEQRYDGVEWFRGDALARARVRETLRGVGDIERVINRVVNRQAGPREMAALGRSLAKLPELAALLQRDDIPALIGAIPIARQAAAEIERAIADEPPTLLSHGGTIAPGYSAELDGLRATLSNDRAYIANLESRERERTGIRSMKVGYNKVFGYYIEVSNANREPLPDDYIRKQTLVNAERYITPELKEAEQRVLAAEECISAAEEDAYARLLAVVAGEAEAVRAAARAVATIDVLAGLAEIASTRGYIRPELHDGDSLRIAEGRHPIIDCELPRGAFVPNDTLLSDDDGRIAILTGPNMAGKSTYLRQVALIVLLAQLGSFVPAASAEIGIVDRIFTRIGAQDDLASGQSTFMVEMLETAAILNHATPRSLIVLDEIGRGTSTYDGLAIATAIVEYLHNTPRLNSRTLFATHYHELTALAEILPRVRNYRLDVLEAGDAVTFLHRVVPGGADRSYGVYVAQLAGMPRQVVRRATEVLGELERNGNTIARREDRQSAISRPTESTLQLNLFGANHPVLDDLRALEVESLSPLDALTTLYALKQRLDTPD